jgi:hypothetical protein
MATPDFHYLLIDTVMEHNKVVIAAPRSSAKSTILVFLFPIFQIMFKRKKFILIISNTFKKAAMHLDTIKRELADNERLKTRHPPITLARDAEGDTIFQHQDGFKTMVLCKGVDQIGSVRGVKFGASRPDLIICDDMEDDELVRNVERRENLKQLYDEALVPAGAPGCQIVVVGTIFHDDSQLAKMLDPSQYKDYYKIFLRAFDENSVKSLWPEKWSLEFLEKLKKESPNVYAKEYQNDPVAGTNTRFKRSDFRYYEERGGSVSLLLPDGTPQTTYSLSECRAAIACDLAWKESRTSDSSVIMPGLLTPNSEILVYDYVSKKGMRPDETAEYLFSICARLEAMTGSTVPVGFEKAMLENVTQWLLKREMKARNKFLVTKELVWDADKNTRIETRLQPRYCQHVIYHKHGMGSLEYQLERFPYGVHDDEVDCLQGLVQLLQFPKARTKEIAATDEFMRVRKILIDSKNTEKRPRKISARPEHPQMKVYTSWR